MKLSEVLSLDEAVYPETFNLAEFKAQKSFRARLAYVKARLAPVAKGSSRAVFVIDDNTVLKVAMNAKGLAQNRNEYSIASHSSYPVAKVFESGDDDVWLEAQRASKITPAMFQQITGIPFRAFGQCLTWWYNDNNGIRRGEPKPVGYDEYMDWDNEFVEGLLSMIADYNMPPGDMTRPSSWGMVKGKDGQPRAVLIDYGLTKDTHEQHYS